MNKKIILIASLLIIFGFVARLLPHPANFAPIGAIALFAGLYLPKRWAIILPLTAMLISDLFIGLYQPTIMIAVYASFAIMGVIGLLIRKNKKLSTILGGTLLGSLLFFLITNFAVWAFGSLYVHNLAGLAQSYIMALPFFKNSLMGDMFYVGILVGSMETVTYLLKNKKLTKAVSLSR